MFCDLVQSTRLANTLDPEDLQLVFAAVHRIVREVSRRHAGYVIRFVGDGAFVVFGYPAAEEDSAESAVRAGLDFVHTIRQARPVEKTELEMRVGIASGRVVMGEVIDGAAIDERSITGPVAHLAARLVSAAPPGGVVLCDTTRRLVGRRFEVGPLGELQFAGFPEPMLAWIARRELAVVSRFDARHPDRRSELIGREALLTRLRALWLEATLGKGRAVELIGDAGVGKSRLARALQQSLASETVLHLDLHCSPRARNSPLYPLRTLLRRLAGVLGDDDEAAALAKARILLASSVVAVQASREESTLSALRHLLLAQPTAAGESDSPERVRERTIEAVVTWVGALTARSPVLLLVEDLQWADATTVLVVERLLRAAATQPLMVVITQRAENAVTLPALPQLTRWRVDPLDVDESRRLVQQIAAEQGVAPELVASIAARGEGNALFIEELTRAALEAATPAAAQIPDTLQNIIQARLDRLPNYRPLVQAAAVLGRDFSRRLLELLCADGGDLAAAIGSLVEDGLFVATGAASQGDLRFRHALIHDAVYQTLLRGERQRLHGRAAELLATNGAAGDAPPDLLAHHLAQAGQIEEAVRCLIAASQATASRAAYAEAIGHAQNGLRLVEQLAEAPNARALRRALLAQSGHSLTATQGYAAPAVEQTFAEALQLCDDATNPVELYPIVRGLGTYYLVRGRTQRADALARQCVALAERAALPELLIDAYSFAAYPAYYLGRLEDSQRDLERSLALYEAEQGDRFVYPNVQGPGTAALALLTSTAWLRGDLAAAERAAASLHELVARLKRPFDDTYAKVWFAASCLLQRRFVIALEHAQAGLTIAQTHGYGTWVPAALMQLCIASGALSPAPEQVATLRNVHGAFLQAGAEVSATFYAWGIAMSLAVAGDREAARAAAEAGLQRARLGEETNMQGELHILLAGLEDNSAGARAHLQAAIDHALAQGAYAVALRATALMRLGDAASAETHAAAQAALEVLDGAVAAPADSGYVRRVLAELASPPNWA